jgi:outer membrane protein TolC
MNGFRLMLCLAVMLWSLAPPAPARAASMDLEAEVPELKDRLLQRYDSAVADLAKAEGGYQSLHDQEFASQSKLFADGPPQKLAPWWNDKVGAPLTGAKAIGGNVESLFVQALQYSTQVKVFADLPLIRRTTIQEAEGPFDLRLFAEGNYSDLDEPVGDELRTGGPERYEEQGLGGKLGVRKLFSPGTDITVEQELRGLDTNSIYFNPHDQALAITRLRVTQPLLHGIGTFYNTSTIELARLDHSISQDELRRQLESHLLEISRAYWGLYLERALVIQKRKLARDIEKLYEQMKARGEIDALPSLLARAKSLAMAKQLDAAEAEFAMKNAEDRIRALVNDPQLAQPVATEIVTHQAPRHQLSVPPMEEVLKTALHHRPEVEQAIKQIRSAAIRQHRAENERWPDLNLFFETYVIGLEGDYEYDAAYEEQFNEGRPSYRVGLRLDYPWGNRAADARLLRKKIEVRQLLRQLDTTVENVLLESKVSYREVIKNHKELVRRYQVMEAAREEINGLLARIDVLLADREPYADMLYRLMDASERLGDAEMEFSRTELTYNLSLYNLQRVMGMLVDINRIEAEEIEQDGLPLLRLKKNPEGPTAPKP